jgi:hypothetical protein
MGISSITCQIFMRMENVSGKDVGKKETCFISNTPSCVTVFEIL